MAMNGMAEAAQDELVTRYFEQAVAQGMDPFSALQLAQTAAGDMLGPLRPAATSEEIYGTASPAERMAAPRLAIADAGPVTVTRQPEPIAMPRPAPTVAPRPEPEADLMVMSRSEPMVLPRPEMLSREPIAPMRRSPEPVSFRTEEELAADEDTLRRFRQQRQLERDEDTLRRFRQQRQLEKDEETLRQFRQQRQLAAMSAPRVVRSPGVYDMAPDVAMAAPRVVRSPGVYDMAPDMMRDRALEEAAARAFNAPPPPPVTLERSSLADSLLRSLGLR